MAYSRGLLRFLTGFILVSAVWCAVIDTTSETIKKQITDTVEFDCHVTGLTASQQVIWKFIDHNITISADRQTHVQPDSYIWKYEVFKPQDAADYWSLRVRVLEAADAGSYRCYVSGLEDTVKVTHHLEITDAPVKPQPPILDVTSCCRSRNVSCSLPLCRTNTSQAEYLQILMSGSSCIDDELLDVIVCGQGGRNHMGCCLRSDMSPECQPLCGGIYDPETDVDYTSCIVYGQTIMQCFVEGTGAFLILCAIMLVIVCIPLFLPELIVRQRLRKGGISVLELVWSYLRDIMMVSCLGVVYFISLWSVLYLKHIFCSLLPWSTNRWAGTGNSADVVAECKPSYQYDPKLWIEEAARVILSLGLAFGGFLAVQSYMLMLNNYYRNADITNRGTSVLAGAVFSLIVCLVLVGLRLSGTLDAINFDLTPDFSRQLHGQISILANAQEWLEATRQIFSLGLAFGVALALALYVLEHNYCYKRAVMVSVVNCSVLHFATFAMLVSLVQVGLLLSGAVDGNNFYSTPDLSRLWHGQEWFQAAFQVFSLGTVLVTMTMLNHSYLGYFVIFSMICHGVHGDNLDFSEDDISGTSTCIYTFMAIIRPHDCSSNCTAEFLDGFCWKPVPNNMTVGVPSSGTISGPVAAVTVAVLVVFCITGLVIWQCRKKQCLVIEAQQAVQPQQDESFQQARSHNIRYSRAYSRQRNSRIQVVH